MENFKDSSPEVDNSEQFLLGQFNKPDKIKFGDNEVSVVDISPKDLKTETPTIMVPGFSATPEALKDSILRTAQAGRRVISPDAPHGIELTEGEYEDADLPEAEMRKFKLFLQLLEEKNIEKINAIVNSEGSIYIAAAALLYPEKFENIVFVDPAGIIGKDSFLAVLNRTLQDIKKQKATEASKQKVKYPSPDSIGPKSIVSNIPASIREVNAIAHSDITSLLEQIHNSGIGVSIIHGIDDQIFPMERVQKMVKANMVDGFYSVEGTHNSIYLYEPYGRVAEMALTALENKKKLKEVRNKT